MSGPALPEDLAESVRRALDEDIGRGDLTARLVPDSPTRAELLLREEAVLCGTAWFDEVFRQLDSRVRSTWSFHDGQVVPAHSVICRLEGPARALLTGERTAINFLQTLSGTATATSHQVAALRGTQTRLLDTRKTIPGLRRAQKFAVACGGGLNHRMGLYDAVLIKENHINACGSIHAALEKASRQTPPSVPIEIEVEDLDQLQQALAAGARHILLDNFDPATLRQAVSLTAGRARLEASGGITHENIREIADTGVDFVSLGSLTKHLRAIDFSLRFIQG